ncbi:hypothetical protein UFOVP558_17 [uncultured Caudovirales phage]|uniref:Bacteriophage protein n=1 Tax=uncultured Caudovirales phage TaxID=2100421 RepID=A0A6J5MSA1_9CAUD|nr:hypothetical protein UFOVP558_17 [uncultured Caudovirales phage]
MSAYLYQAPCGVPGDVTRPDESNVEPAMLIAISAVYAQKFGIPMKYATGGISQIASGDAATVFAGILVRQAPGISGNALSGLDDTTPNPDQVQGLLVRGYGNVRVFAGTPARGGVVYMQVTANGGAVVGDLRADGTDSGNAVALTNTQASWATDGKDADGNAEIRVAR